MPTAAPTAAPTPGIGITPVPINAPHIILLHTPPVAPTKPPIVAIAV